MKIKKETTSIERHVAIHDKMIVMTERRVNELERNQIGFKWNFRALAILFFVSWICFMAVSINEQAKIIQLEEQIMEEREKWD